MRELRIEKLVLNICVGESGDRLTRAANNYLVKPQFNLKLDTLSELSVLEEMKKLPSTLLSEVQKLKKSWKEV